MLGLVVVEVLVVRVGDVAAVLPFERDAVGFGRLGRLGRCPRVGALAGTQRGEGVAHRPLQRRPLRGLARARNAVAHFAAGVAAVPAQTELARREIVHAQVEELHVDLAGALEGFGRDDEVHVAVVGGGVVLDVQTALGGEVGGKVLGGGWDGFDDA